MSKAITKVGCCGFAVARPKYFATFPVVEIQQTFYQPPKQDTVKRWRDEAPADFEFTLKAWQLITHEPSSPTYRRLKEFSPATCGQGLPPAQVRGLIGEAGSFQATDIVRRAWDTTLQMARLLTADKVIFQCPARFRPTSENMDRIRAFFSNIDREGVICIWEPRGKWQDEQIGQLCRELNLVHCVDPFKAESVTAGLRYYRLHGITGYRHNYTDDELRDLLRRRVKDTSTYHLFNNVSMYHDASGFKELLK